MLRDDFDALRELAKSQEYQILYARAKELGQISLFKNRIDFTQVQIKFLSELELYHSLYVDLALDEKYLTQDVIDDAIRCQAYLTWKNNERKEKLDKQRKQSPREFLQDEENLSPIPSIKFVTREGKKK